MNIEFEEIKNEVQGINELDNKLVNEPIQDFSLADSFSQDPEEQKKELIERLKIKTKILQYNSKFPQELEAYNYKMNQLDMLSIADLQIFLDEIKIAVNTNCGSNMLSHLYFGGVNVFERIAVKMGYQLTGFSSILKQQPDVYKCLDQISLEMGDNMYMPPHVRLAYLTLNAAIMCNNVQKVENVINNEIKKPIKEKLTIEYQDL
jgi:hypothetical protein